MKTKVTQRFRQGRIVRMTDDALENYGSKYDDMELVVISVSTKYCPSSEHFKPNHDKSCAGHPGFDDAGNCALYDLAFSDDDGDLNHLPMSLYDWELR